MIKSILIILFIRVPIVLLLVIVILAITKSLVVPIYKFADPAPFSGDMIYNPYVGFDSTKQLLKGNFHAHARMLGGLTNGAKPIKEVVLDYASYGYDVIGISNYQTITTYDPRPEFRIPVYEHGYNVQKYHQLVFGAHSLTNRDCIFPVSNSSCQWVLNHVIKNADAVGLNHPRFTLFFPVERMKYIRGYRFIEADAGMSPAFEWWDMGLSSGIPSFILSGDDSHNTSRSHDIASHCVFIGSQTAKYADVISTLKSGNFYSMKIPNFGDGDLAIKHMENVNLPKIKNIGMSGDSLFVHLGSVADTIKFWGQNGTIKSITIGSDSGIYYFSPADTYIRAEIIFSNGIKIYTNPAFRYSGGDPFAYTTPPVDWLLTLLSEALRLLIMSFFTYLTYLVARPIFRCKQV